MSASGRTREAKGRRHESPAHDTHDGRVGPAPAVGARAARARAGGEALDPAVRSFFEPRFDHRFDDVRVYSGAEANAVAESYDANAVTIESDLYFANGAADLSSPAGRHRLAHELAHVVQYDRSGVAWGPGAAVTTGPGEAAEVEARAAATTVLAGGQASPGATPSAPVAREEKERGLNLDLLPPSLSYGFGAGGGSANLSLSPGGLGAEYKRGLFHGDATMGFGGSAELNLGLGAPLMPWMMDVNRDLTGAAGGMNQMMNGRGFNAGALSGFGALGGIYGAGEPSKHSWGAGLQLSHSDEETRAMLGLRFDL